MEQYSNRKYFILGAIILVGLIISVRLLFLQVVSDYSGTAESQTRRREVVYPHRGLIFDRNGELLVGNKFVYDLKIAPYELEAFDTAVLCEMVRIDKATLMRRINYVLKNPDERYNPIVKQLSDSTYGRLKERTYDLHGFYFSRRTLREYKREIAAHLLGYIGEVDAALIKKDDYYESGDYYGVSGVEFSYEPYLRGVKGCRYLLKDAHGRVQGSYKNGRLDTAARKGRDLTLTIDAGLQEYGEELMKGYRGSIVAIEPATGEVLAYVSAPSYKPGILVGRQREANYFKLSTDSLNPLFNYAIQAQYPPGSTFKPINALIAQQEQAIQERTRFKCNMGFYRSGYQPVGCHHTTSFDLPHAIQQSCNTYFCEAYRLTIEDKDYASKTAAYDNWRNHLSDFGLGQASGIDLPFENKGLIPDTGFYNKMHPTGWGASHIISLSIGQGEILLTPLQLANMAAAIANRGYYYTPHVVKQIAGIREIDERYRTPHRTRIDTSFFDPVIEGMELAVNQYGGTAYWVRHSDITICGKTGTAENPHGKDHSVFMAFAPKDDPKIAVSVYVEHGEQGSRYAAPIASLIIEKYLTGKIITERKWIEKRIMEGNLLREE